MRTRVFKNLLPVKLDEHEKSEIGQSLVHHMKCMDDLDDELRGFKERIKLAKSSHEHETVRLRKALATGSEDREIECVDIPDYRGNSVRVVRLDTMETVLSRTMAEEERQQSLIPDQYPEAVQEMLAKIDGAPTQTSLLDDEGEPDGSPEQVPAPVEKEDDDRPLPQHSFTRKEMVEVAEAMEKTSRGFYRAVIEESAQSGATRIGWAAFTAVAAERDLLDILAEARGK